MHKSNSQVPLAREPQGALVFIFGKPFPYVYLLHIRHRVVVKNRDVEPDCRAESVPRCGLDKLNHLCLSCPVCKLG